MDSYLSDFNGFRDRKVKRVNYEERDDSSSSSSGEDEQLYCICRRASHGQMIQCDKCCDWYHFSCVGITDDNTPAQYVCGICRQDDGAAVQLLMLLSRNSNSGESSSDDSDYDSPAYPERSRSPLSPISPPPVSPSPQHSGIKVETKDLPTTRDLNGNSYVLPKPFPMSPTTTTTTRISISPPPTAYDPFFANTKSETPPMGSPTGITSQQSSPDYTSSQGPVFQPNPVRSRKRKNENQMGVLMKYYEQNPDPDLNMKKRIADETRLTVKQVSDWFYNLRVRKKFKVKS